MYEIIDRLTHCINEEEIDKYALVFEAVVLIQDRLEDKLYQVNEPVIENSVSVAAFNIRDIKVGSKQCTNILNRPMQRLYQIHFLLLGLLNSRGGTILCQQWTKNMATMEQSRGCRQEQVCFL